MNGLKSIDLYNEKLKSGIVEQDDMWSVIEFLSVYLGKEVGEKLTKLVAKEIIRGVIDARF